MEDDTDDVADIGMLDDRDEPSTTAEGDTLRGDIEESIAKQLAKKGNPEPYRGLRGRTDTGKTVAVDAKGAKIVTDNPHYQGLESFAREAARNGTNLRNALADYGAIEKSLKQDFVGGVEHICQRLGVSPQQLAQVMAQRYGIAVHQQPQQSYQAQAQQYQAYQADYQRHTADIEASRRSMPMFDTVRPAMAQLAQQRPDLNLKQLYGLVMKANPSLGMSAEIARRDNIRDKQMGRGKRK